MRQYFRVIVRDAGREIFNRIVPSDNESGEAADIALDELQHPNERELELHVTEYHMPSMATSRCGHMYWPNAPFWES